MSTIRKILVGAALLVALAIPAAASAATPVTSLSGDWAKTNSTLRLTTSGVNFGVYPTANSGGSLYYAGANGLTLTDLTDLSYTFNYQALNEPGSYTAAPYLRVFLNGDTDDVILDPSHCATTPVPQNTDVTLQMVGGSVRYDDDGCDGVAPDEQPWVDVLGAHGSDIISGIYVTQGFAVGDSFSADLPQMTVQGETFAFGAPQAGPTGPAGTNGSNGATGATGATGAASLVAGPAGINQTVISPVNLRGDTVRTLHAPSRKGKKLVSVRGWLRTSSGLKRLKGGKSVKVDLRGKAPANYNVILKAKYRRADGSTFERRTERNLSVTVVKP